jgi:hypothetical protein
MPAITNAQQVGFYNPLRKSGIRSLRGRRGALRGLAASAQDIADAQSAVDQSMQALQTAQDVLAQDTADGNAEFVAQDQAMVAGAQAQLSADQAALAALTAGGAASTATVPQVVSSIPSSTQQALQQVNPNVFNATTISQLVQQITAAMANSNLTGVQRQALQNQLATYQGGLFSPANMPILLIGGLVLFMVMGKR